MKDILEGLNSEQKIAVEHGAGPLLIVAGAGTGKTTVVTRRIAQLIESGLAEPDEILALTFTEKAAGEMEERVDALLTDGYVDLWISTFHAFGERLLRDHALDIGLSSDFRMLPDTEQWMLLREHIEEFELDYYRPKGNPSKFVQGLISHFSRLKDEDILPQAYLDYAQQLQLDLDTDLAAGKEQLTEEQQAQVDEATRVLEAAKAYAGYQKLLRENNALDFGDLIVETIHLLQDRPGILAHYRKQFKYILVDEFQDTNIAQYDLVKLLAGPEPNLTVVADDDQAIYSFRGASMSNIADFKKDFPDAVDVSLVQNYRSTQPILDLSYEFIQHNNPERLEPSLGIDKRLKANANPDAEASTQIEHLHADTHAGEVKLVMDKIIALKEKEPDLAWSDFAILVRANNHAQDFLPYFDRSGIPYQFMASKGLFSKPVILDVIAFLDVLRDYHNSRALYRVFNFEIWNIPPQDLMTMTRQASKNTQSLFELCREIRLVPALDEQTYAAVEKVLALVDKLATQLKYRTVGEIALLWMEESGYLKTITDQETEEAQEQILYLNQFFNYIQAFERGALDKSVGQFMEELNLMIEAGDNGKLSAELADGPDAVRLMTIHGSKGLEFEHVFVVNMVSRRFPSSKRREAIEVPEAIVKETLPEGDWHLQEERRLFYVAMTRAKRGLYLTSAADYGGARKKKVSRFLVEAGFEDIQPEHTGQVQLGSESAPITQEQAKEELKQLPKTFSFTQLKAFESCPWQYRFAFLLKVPTPGKPSFSFGKTMHNTLYEFFRRLKEGSESQQMGLFGEDTAGEPTLKDMLEIYEQKWQGEWYYTKKQKDEYYTNGKKALQQFYELHKDQWPNALYLEKGFKLGLGEYGIKGAIDRVDALDESGENVEVIDYKTGNFPKSGKRDMEQLYLYALAIRQVFKVEPVKLSYYYVESNKVIEEDVDSDKMQQVSEWALGLIEEILKGDFTPNPGFQCKYCDFAEICEYKAK
jgi:DNA helicase-2/ATP-dependent DNA helicase PcrA